MVTVGLLRTHIIKTCCPDCALKQILRQTNIMVGLINNSVTYFNLGFNCFKTKSEKGSSVLVCSSEHSVRENNLYSKSCQK